MTKFNENIEALLLFVVGVVVIVVSFYDSFSVFVCTYVNDMEKNKFNGIIKVS